jgi:NAD(P)H-hydrate epimerase
VDAVNDFVRRVHAPCVIDADAIHAMAKGRIVSKNKLVFTPHAHEFFVLTGKKVGNSESERITAVKEAARRLGATILLKGAIAVISDGSDVAVNRKISRYATKGGIGDAIAGVCASLLAQGAKPFDAACAASYIIGAATELAVAEKKQSVLATDIIEKIPRVI